MLGFVFFVVYIAGFLFYPFKKIIEQIFYYWLC